MSLVRHLTTQYSGVFIKALPAVCLLCLLACPAPAQVQQLDAISREITVYNDPYPGQDAITDTISREVTVYNDPYPGQDTIVDAISREVTVYNDPYPGQDAITDTISREITVYNDPYPGQDAITDAVSREITVLRETLGQAKAQPDGGVFGISGVTGAIVTAVFPDCIYVELPDRSSGIRVTGATATEGRRVNISGSLKTSAVFERYVEATDVVDLGTASVGPLCARARDIYCGDLLVDTLIGGGQLGMTGGVGTNMVGLLVRVAGAARSPQAGSFRIDDGFEKSIKVLLPAGCSLPDDGEAVSVTAILSMEQVNTNLLPVLRVRRSDDITKP